MTKRTSDQFMAMDDEELDVELENIPITENCDQIRRKIRALIDNGEMKVGEFQKAINVTGAGYSRFMGQNGVDKGFGSDVFPAAWAFFKKRELRGIKTTANKKAKKDAAGGKNAVPDVKDITLDGEEDDAVPVYDTCDEIRRKINAHLKKPGVVQADFLREASASFHKNPAKLTSRTLSAFRSKKGPCAGNTSGMFYGAYVYFEKLRIKEKKPKSKKRLEMEEIHGGTGMDTKKSQQWVICGPNERPYVDSYGKMSIGRLR
ncbi:hypothetical protein GQ44DRAFT_627815 [Phaeosphaeriaceae sp. PMI808]|nr:hypothetical protein GQ44DRAFT_627815 [Phaeosphaeriaceae sp. PMI808]